MLCICTPRIAQLTLKYGVNGLCTVNMLKLLTVLKNTIHLLGIARPTMHVDHSTIIAVGVIILFFYVDLSYVSKLQVL